MKQDLLKPGQGARTGKKLTDCRGLVVHWIGAAQGHAAVIRRNFERSRFGAHFISDWYTGEIVQCVPEDEVCYHVGAERYTETKRAVCGEANPNWYLVGVECCIGDRAIPGDWSATGKHMDLGKPSDVQYEALVAFAADFLKRHGLGADKLYRHYDITGKPCHIWFVKDLSRWEKFKADVTARMEGSDVTKEEVQAIVEEALRAAQPRVYTDMAEVPKWAQGLVRRAVEGGIIRGDGAGRLHLTDDNLINLQMMFNMADKAGK